MTTPMASTRRALHVVAELLIAGPQYASCGDIRLTVTAATPVGPPGFTGMSDASIAVAGTYLVTPAGRFPLQGDLGQLAADAGITPRRLTDVYSGGPDIADDETLEVDRDAALEILFGFADGNAALQSFAATEQPILWPEHFDIGIAEAAINYGVSPGDSYVPVPYAYVGPWTPRTGEFWNQSFGAARPLSELGGSAGIVEFFEAGRRAAVER